MMSSLLSAVRSHASTTLAGSLLLAATVGAHAGTITIVNGDFSSTTLTKSAEFGTRTTGLTTSGNAADGATNAVTGWTTSGYNILYMSPTAAADTTYGTNNVTLASATVSPNGGNFVALDAQGGYTGALQQTISGFNVGDLVSVSFYYAAAQQSGYTGTNNESLAVSLGNQTLTTPSLAIAQGGFSGWQQDTLTFTATSTSEVLSFLAQDGPNGAPPMVLLDGVTATSTSPVPEPSSLALLGTGLAGFAGVIRRFKR